MVKKFTIPFASQGDANDIPDALQVDGKVSFTQGFGYDYERPYDDPQAKDIAREDMNGLFKAVTSAIGELQTQGASEWSNAIAYPKGVIVYYEKDLYISQVDDNKNEPPQNWVSITSIANDSLKKAMNLSDLTDKATARNNLGLGTSATLNKTDVLGTSTSLVATQKLVNDTKINLENSKQDKLTFIGDGPEVMRAGAFGLGAEGKIRSTNIDDANIKSGFYFATSSDTSAPHNSSVIHMRGEDVGLGGQIAIRQFGDLEIYARRLQQEFSEWHRLYHTANTTIDKSGFLRATSSANALTDQNNQQIGVGQQWVNVTSQRTAGTIYTNNTDKPIEVAVTLRQLTGNNEAQHTFVVDGVSVGRNVTRFGDYEKASFTIAIVPSGSRYSITDTHGSVYIWAELR